MEPITLQVDAEVARAYQEANLRDKQTIQMLFNMWLKQRIQNRSLDGMIADMQSQASQQGLTQEILDEILQDG